MNSTFSLTLRSYAAKQRVPDETQCGGPQRGHRQDSTRADADAELPETICNDDSCYSQRSGYHIQHGVVLKDLRRLTGEDIYELLQLRLLRRRLHRRGRARRGLRPEKIA
ncbi:MAG: hypothetical protein CL494_01425 [Actinobacteria bacterium]|nr:hypothetical protein [Actinomycetota bacterium]